MDEKTKAEIKKFVEYIKKGFEYRNYVKEICDIKEFDSKIDKHKNFIQIPIRILMELEDFDGTVSNEPLGRDLGEELAAGEFNQIIEKLKNLDIESTIKKLNMETLTSLLKKLPLEFQPTFILIPIDSELYHHMYELVDGGIAKYESDGLFINIMDYHIKVIWSSKMRPFKNVYLIGKDGVRWIYKNNRDMKKIRNLSGYKDDFDEETSKINFVYKQFGRHKLDFIFRVVGLAGVNENKVRKYGIE